MTNRTVLMLIIACKPSVGSSHYNCLALDFQHSENRPLQAQPPHAGGAPLYAGGGVFRLGLKGQE